MEPQIAEIQTSGFYPPALNPGSKPKAGAAISAAPTEELFQQLAAQWREETAHLSLLIKKVMHPAYQRIIGLGPAAIPLLLRELQRKPGHWTWALRAVTGEDPTQPNDSVTQAAQAWLQWGKERHYL